MSLRRHGAARLVLIVGSVLALTGLAGPAVLTPTAVRAGRPLRPSGRGGLGRRGWRRLRGTVGP